MSQNVRYEKQHREKAKREKKWLVTVEVNGKHLRDDSMCVQGCVDLEFAKRVRDFGLEMFRKPKNKGPKQ